MATALLAAGADPNAPGPNGRTPLHEVADLDYGGEAAVAAVLLAAGADTEARCRSGWTPLHYATFGRGDPELVEALLDAGADPTAKNERGQLPWQLVRRKSDLIGTDLYRRLRQARPE